MRKLKKWCATFCANEKLNRKKRSSSPGFTNKQFTHALSIDRSDSLRNLAHEEWKS